VFFGVKGHWVQDTFVFVLREDTGRDIVGRVGFNYYFSVVVKMVEYRGRRELFFEEVEGCLLLQSSRKWKVFASLFFRHSGQWCHHFRIILHEPSVKIGKSKEALDICNIPRNLPSQDTGNLLRVHLDSIGGDCWKSFSVLEARHCCRLELSGQHCWGSARWRS